jgi:hypothetical protein
MWLMRRKEIRAMRLGTHGGRVGTGSAPNALVGVGKWFRCRRVGDIIHESGG